MSNAPLPRIMYDPETNSIVVQVDETRMVLACNRSQASVRCLKADSVGLQL